MRLAWLLFSSNGNLDRKGFWFAVLGLYFISMMLDIIGNSIFLEIGSDKISFFMFFLTKMIPRLFGILILVFSFFISKKRVNDIGAGEWVPIIYVITLFLPSFLMATGATNLFIMSIIFPIIITFYLGLAAPGVK